MLILSTRTRRDQDTQVEISNKLWTNYINLGTGWKAWNIYDNLASLLLLANLSWDIIIGLLFDLKCTRSATPTINPQIKVSTELVSINLSFRLLLHWTLYGGWQPTWRCITTTNWTRDLSSSFNHPRGFMLLKTNEVGEAGLATRKVSQIEPSSILAPGYADMRRQCGCNDWITCMCTFIFQCSCSQHERCGQHVMVVEGLYLA
jgi:hypothetical protein